MLTELGERLALIIDARTDGAVANVRKLAAAEEQAGLRADELRAKIADLEARGAKRPLTNAAGLQLSRAKNELQGLEATLANVPAKAGVAERALAKVGLAGRISPSALSGGLAAAGATIGIFAEFEFFKKGIDGYIGLASAIRQVQQAASSSTQDASRLVAITNALGVDSQTAALGVFRLGKNIELTPQKLSDYGIAIARDKQGNTDLIGTLENVAKAYQGTADPARRAAIVYEAFGRAGTSMLPILNANVKSLRQITAEAAKQGRIFTPNDLAQARNYQIAMRELGDSWQALAISAGKDLVPAIAGVAREMTGLVDLANRSHAVDFLVPVAGIAHLFGLGRHKGLSAQAKAAVEEQDAETKARIQNLQTAALATLPGATDVLAGPAAIAAAKKTLTDAVTALHLAQYEREKAVRDLQKAKTAAPGADAASLTAATLRLAAAEANLRKAEYLGGTARIDTAQASVISAEATLNRLRATGGVNTDKLATAEERLHRASLKVSAAQKAEHAAQQAANQATGLSLNQVLIRIAGQAKSQQALADANAQLATKGLSTAAIADLDKLEKQVPGTLGKVAKSMTAGFAAQINAHEADIAAAAQEFGLAASQPGIFLTAGKNAGQHFIDGFKGKLSDYGFLAPPVAKPHPGQTNPFGGVLNSQFGLHPIVIQGDLNVTGVDNPTTLARKTYQKARLDALSP